MPKKNNPGCKCCFSVVVGRVYGYPSGSTIAVEKGVGSDAENKAWQYDFGDTFLECSLVRMTASDRILACIAVDYSPADAQIHTLESDGTYLSSFTLTGSPTPYFGRDMAADASGNIYICAASSGTQTLAQKYSSAGSKSWEVPLNFPGIGWRVDVDDVGTSVWGTYNTDASNPFLLCYNSAGSLQWSHTETVRGQVDVWGLAIGLDGYVYVYSLTGSTIWELRKFDLSTGTEVTSGNWPVTLSAFRGNLCCDVDSNIYIGGGLNSSPLLKYNNSGSLVWTSAFSTIGAYRPYVDTAGNPVFVLGTGGLPDPALYSKVDGSNLVTRLYGYDTGKITSACYFPGPVAAFG